MFVSIYFLLDVYFVFSFLQFSRQDRIIFSEDFTHKQLTETAMQRHWAVMHHIWVTDLFQPEILISDGLEFDHICSVIYYRFHIYIIQYISNSQMLPELSATVRGTM